MAGSKFEIHHLSMLQLAFWLPKETSGEEKSISLGYALGIRTHQTPPIRASKRNTTGKNKT
jgi:hypothetical protein